MSLNKYSWVQFTERAGVNPYLKHYYNNTSTFEYNNKNFNISMLCIKNGALAKLDIKYG